MAGIPKGRWIPIAAAAAVLVAVAIGAVMWWADQQKYETTENAFVAADKVTVAPLVDGYVAEVLVDDNQVVSPGQVLVRIDPASLKARLAEAEANARALEAAVAQVDDRGKLEQAMIAQRAAAVDSANAQASLATSELARYGRLAEAGWVSPQRAQTAAPSSRPPPGSIRPRPPWRPNGAPPPPWARPATRASPRPPPPAPRPTRCASTSAAPRSAPRWRASWAPRG